MDKHPYKIIVLSLILIACGGILLVLMSKPNKNQNSQLPSVVAREETDSSSVTSPDGKLTLLMKKNKDGDSTRYTFWTVDSGGTQKEVFTKTISSTSTISIPSNTFSPDDKYIFLKENDTGVMDYFAVTPSGALDISGLFAAKYPNYKITDVTGWGGMTLIVVNVNNSDGSIGPSFWFDVLGKSFIRLSDRFN